MNVRCDDTRAVTKRLADSHDCLVFHATGTGGQSMEKLVDSGLLSAVIDVSDAMPSPRAEPWMRPARMASFSRSSLTVAKRNVEVAVKVPQVFPLRK